MDSIIEDCTNNHISLLKTIYFILNQKDIEDYDIISINKLLIPKSIKSQNINEYIDDDDENDDENVEEEKDENVEEEDEHDEDEFLKIVYYIKRLRDGYNVLNDYIIKPISVENIETFLNFINSQLKVANYILSNSISLYLKFKYPDNDNEFYLNTIIKNMSLNKIDSIDNIINEIIKKPVIDNINSKNHLLPKLKDYIIKINIIINNYKLRQNQLENYVEDISDSSSD
jgi:hypothetical protein